MRLGSTVGMADARMDPATMTRGFVTPAGHCFILGDNRDKTARVRAEANHLRAGLWHYLSKIQVASL
jgi:hypothetical protein